ncbi:phosphatidylethanolamine N-methyltransferase, partial [Ascosphaera atra]
MTSPMTPEELPPGGVMDPAPGRRRGGNSATGRAGFNLRERRTTTVERETKVTPETEVDFQGKGEGKADLSSTAPGEEADASTSKKTYGRTPDGTVFLVPQTHDMVTQLLSPTSPKNYSDLLVLTILTLHVLLLTYLPPSLRIPVFAAVFLFWRAAYNVGIGILLHNQSTHGRLVLLARKYKIFENPSTGNQPRPRLYSFLKRELETKIPADYNFDSAPLEYNTWLVFRRI